MESDYRHSREQNACTILSCLTKGTKGVRLESTTVRGLAVRRNVGLGSPTNSQPGRLRYVAQASGLRVLAASSRQFWWYLQDAPVGDANTNTRLTQCAYSGIQTAQPKKPRTPKVASTLTPKQKSTNDVLREKSQTAQTKKLHAHMKKTQMSDDEK